MTRVGEKLHDCLDCGQDVIALWHPDAGNGAACRCKSVWQGKAGVAVMEGYSGACVGMAEPAVETGHE